MTEYVGLFFILSNCSIQSTFLLFCKILVCVVFAAANNTPYRSPLPGASITFLPFSQLRLVSFYLVLIFFLFLIFFFTIMFSSSKIPIFQALFISGFIFILSMREQKFVSTLNSVENVAIQILGRGPNWPHKPYRCEPWHSPSARESTQISTFTMAQQRAWARFGVFSKRNCYFWFRFRP